MENEAKEHRSDAESDILYESTQNAVTITIRGEALYNLRKLADTLQKIEWGAQDGMEDSDISVLETFIVGNDLDNLACKTETLYGRMMVGGVGEIAGFIVDAIDTDAEDGSQLDRRRRKELREAFQTAGLIPCNV